jgi:hypothetical protein
MTRSFCDRCHDQIFDGKGVYLAIAHGTALGELCPTCFHALQTWLNTPPVRPKAVA